MNVAVIELNDQELRVAQDGNIVVRSPAGAIVRGAEIKVGDSACREAYLHPRNYHNRFWYQLDQSGLPRSSREVRHHADLAFRHLKHSHQAAGSPASMVFAIPGGYTKTQLSLLLGIVEACKIDVRAFVDSAVAAAVCVAPGTFHHIEIQRHRAVITTLLIDDNVTRTNVETVDGAGFDNLMTRFVTLVSDQFLTQSRFDPLHQADTEQLLYNEMPKWLTLLQSRRELKVHIEFRGSRFDARISKSDLISVADQVYRDIHSRIASHDRCLIGSRLATMPGFVEFRENQFVLTEAAVFDGCTQLAERLSEKKQGVGLLVKLEASKSPTVAVAANVTKMVLHNSDRPDSTPTHILSGTSAYEINTTPLFLSKTGEALHTPSDCVVAHLIRNGTVTRLVAENDARLRLNGRPVQSDTPLRLGDEITVEGSPCIYLPITIAAANA